MTELPPVDNGDDLTKIFEIMDSVTCKNLTEIREKGEGEKQYDANEDQFFDFQSAAYQNKNIRVRPISGVT